jgi:hypothetical protein
MTTAQKDSDGISCDGTSVGDACVNAGEYVNILFFSFQFWNIKSNFLS